MRRFSGRVALLIGGLWLALGQAGCRPHVEVALGPATAPPDDGRWPDAKAVILLCDIDFINIASHDTWYSEWRVHRRIRLRTPASLALADLRIGLDKGEAIDVFKARSVAVDGTVREIDGAALKSAPIKVEDEDVAEVYVASIPGAEVGGLIEYSYAIVDDYATSWFGVDFQRELTLHGLPIVDARVRMTVNSKVRYAVRVTNSRTKVKTVKDGSMRTLTWQASDLGPPPHEMWAPGDDTWPRLQFKVKTYDFKSWRRSVSRSWDDILRWPARHLHGDTERLYTGYEPPAQPECAAGDTMCRVRGALDVAREVAPFDGLSSSFYSGVEPMETVLAERAANQYEKATLVGRMLRDAGVEVQYAFGVRPATNRLSPTYPESWPLNHMLLYLPAQPGLDEAIWLDPGCEHCAPGQLSAYSDGAQMFLLTYTQAMLDTPTVTATRVVARGAAAMPDRRRHHFDVALDGEGTATVRLEETYEGMRAAWFARAARRWSDEERQKAVEERLARIDRRARLLEAPPPTCDRAAGRCSRVLRFIVPGYATVDGRELVVPLSLMHGWSVFDVPKRARTRDMLLPTSDAFDETLALSLPDGYAFAEGPAPFSATSDAFETRLSLDAAGRTVRVERSSTRRQGRYTPAQHGARVEALARAAAANEARIRLRRADP